MTSEINEIIEKAPSPVLYLFWKQLLDDSEIKYLYLFILCQNSSKKQFNEILPKFYKNFCHDEISDVITIKETMAKELFDYIIKKIVIDYSPERHAKNIIDSQEYEFLITYARTDKLIFDLCPYVVQELLRKSENEVSLVYGELISFALNVYCGNIVRPRTGMSPEFIKDYIIVLAVWVFENFLKIQATANNATLEKLKHRVKSASELIASYGIGYNFDKVKKIKGKYYKEYNLDKKALANKLDKELEELIKKNA